MVDDTHYNLHLGKYNTMRVRIILKRAIHIRNTLEVKENSDTVLKPVVSCIII